MVVDIRDNESFLAGRIMDATPLNEANTAQFLANTDSATPVIVCCYHGNMSQSAGAWLAEQGLEEVYSLDGGYAGWAAQYPEECDSGPL